jgi:hypothetical protein
MFWNRQPASVAHTGCRLNSRTAATLQETASHRQAGRQAGCPYQRLIQDLVAPFIYAFSFFVDPCVLRAGSTNGSFAHAAAPRVLVGPGARVGPVYAFLFRHGLMLEGATCPSVGISGLTLGEVTWGYTWAGHLLLLLPLCWLCWLCMPACSGMA